MRGWRVKLGIALIGILAAAGVARSETLTVYAAASLGRVLTDLHENLPSSSGFEVQLVLASSGALARQIERGAPADIFISANALWIDHLADTGRFERPKTVPIAGNRLVVVAPVGLQANGGVIGADTDGADTIEAALKTDGRIAIGDPAHVPAGIYAKQALSALGLWPSVSSRLAPAANVRAALALVERWAAPRGVVYASDAAGSVGVGIIAEIPPESHAPIRYLAVAIRPSATADRYLAMLTDRGTRQAFIDAGFTAPADPD